MSWPTNSLSATKERLPSGCAAICVSWTADFWPCWGSPGCSRITQEGRLSVLMVPFPTFEARTGRGKNQLPAGFKVWEQRLNQLNLPLHLSLWPFWPFQVRQGATVLPSRFRSPHPHRCLELLTCLSSFQIFWSCLESGGYVLKILLYPVPLHLLMPGEEPWRVTTQSYLTDAQNKSWHLTLGLRAEISGYSASPILRAWLLFPSSLSQPSSRTTSRANGLAHVVVSFSIDMTSGGGFS